jgi:hypothetical protein
VTDGPGPVDEVADLTPQWLTTALRATGHTAVVDGVASEPIGHGQIGSNHRLTLTYASGADSAPSTLVAKLGAGDDRSIVSGGYRKEVAFYRDLADTVAVRTPRCRHASINEDGTVFTLLLDDLAPAVVGDQLAGCTTEEAAAAVRNLAGLHGPRWCDPTLWDHPELDAVDADGAAFLGEIFASATGTFVDRYRADLDAGDEPLLRRVADAIPAWMVNRPERFVLLHGDYRSDNLLFSDDGRVSAVDWQTLTVGHPGRDLAYFCETSLTPEHRRAGERALVVAYREALHEHGGAELSEGEAWEDYRLGLLQGPLITVLGAVYATAGRSERADAMFLTMLRRSLAAIDDLDPLALL